MNSRVPLRGRIVGAVAIVVFIVIVVVGFGQSWGVKPIVAVGIVAGTVVGVSLRSSRNK
jgi:hypothetical protein